MMVVSLTTQTTVKPGGFIEVHSDELPEGATVKVTVLVEDTGSAESKSKGLSRFIGINKGKGSFTSAADVDEYIRQGRDSWDS